MPIVNVELRDLEQKMCYFSCISRKSQQFEVFSIDFSLILILDVNSIR